MLTHRSRIQTIAMSAMATYQMLNLVCLSIACLPESWRLARQTHWHRAAPNEPITLCKVHLMQRAPDATRSHVSASAWIGERDGDTAPAETQSTP
jgi:hypothetical protein